MSETFDDLLAIRVGEFEPDVAPSCTSAGVTFELTWTRQSRIDSVEIVGGAEQQSSFGRGDTVEGVQETGDRHIA